MSAQDKDKISLVILGDGGMFGEVEVVAVGGELTRW